MLVYFAAHNGWNDIREHPQVPTIAKLTTAIKWNYIPFYNWRAARPARVQTPEQSFDRAQRPASNTGRARDGLGNRERRANPCRPRPRYAGVRAPVLDAGGETER